MEVDVKKWASFVALMFLVAACTGSKAPENAAAADAASGTANTPANAPVAAAVTPKFEEVTIPAGTTLRLELKSAVASDTSTVEEAVRASLRDSVSIGGRVALPAGSEVVGVVTDVERAGRVKGRARVAYRFNTVRAGGESYDIKTSPIAHVAAATKGKDATKIAIGAGAGAALGALVGGGSGAAKGAAPQQFGKRLPFEEIEEIRPIAAVGF